MQFDAVLAIFKAYVTRIDKEYATETIPQKKHDLIVKLTAVNEIQTMLGEVQDAERQYAESYISWLKTA